MYKIGVMGDRSSVLCFKAVGLDIFPIGSVAEAKVTLQRIIKEEYAIIYITEKLCKEISEEIEKYKDIRVPAIIPIPGMDGSHGLGMANLKKSVERAVGADILFSQN
ncbi:MAG: V-type ATP synthase subunit F [Saccharofermentanales bacterium]